MSSDRFESFISFKTIELRASGIGLDVRELSSLGSVRAVMSGKVSNSPKGFHMHRFFAFVVISLSVFLIVSKLNPSSVGLSTAILTLFRPVVYPFFSNDRCAVSLEVARPHVSNCEFCRNVGEIVKISNISKTDFEEKFVKTGRPVVIVDGQKDWHGGISDNYDIIKEIFVEAKNRPNRTVKERCALARINTGFQEPEEALIHYGEDRLNSKNHRWYVGWGECDWKTQSVIGSHYRLPYFLENRNQPNRYWFAMSRSFTMLNHIDRIQLYWQAQLRGRKKWTLQPPPECYFHCKSYLMETIVEPGQVLFLKTSNWFHETQTIGEDFNIVISSVYSPTVYR